MHSKDHPNYGKDCDIKKDHVNLAQVDQEAKEKVFGDKTNPKFTKALKDAHAWRSLYETSD
jgi:hypothetical protein